MLRNGVLILLSLAASQETYAKGKPMSVVEPPQALARGLAKRLVVVGDIGQLNVVPNPKSDDVQVRASKYTDGEDPQVTPEALSQLYVKTTAVDDAIEVRAQRPNPTNSKHGAEFKVDIAAPSNMSLDIYWMNGNVRVLQWKGPVFLSSQDGHLSLENCLGDLTVRSVFGSLKIDNLKGALSVENLASQVFLNNISGKTRLRTFSGESHLTKIAGPMVIVSQKAPVNIKDSQGGLDIQSGMATFHISDHRGPISGHSEAGQVTARVLGPVEVRLSSLTGGLSVTVGRDSRASVSLSTKGQLNAPRDLEKKSGPDSKVIHGELQGSQPGHLRLTSESGDLTVHVL